MDKEFQKFLQERRYLKNVSPRTVEWYEQSFQWLGTPYPTQADLTAFVIRMREAGLQPSSCNARIRAVNAYLRWLDSSLHLPKLKEPMKVLPTYDPSIARQLLRWHPHGEAETRLQAILLTLVDTGCRISELTALRWVSVDLDNLLLTVTGKGDKQRIIPISVELRKYLAKLPRDSNSELVFPTRTGSQLLIPNLHRAVTRVCKQLGIKIPERKLHAFRHSFALNYLRRGGNVLYLQQVLGHASLEVTRRYAHLQPDDLKEMHRRVSMLT